MTVDLPPFVPLRNHSAYSLLEGAITIPALADLALSHNFPAIGLADSNNLFGALEFSQTLAAKGIQPIIGCKMSVRIRHDEHRKDRGCDGSMVLLAQNEKGYQRLMTLSSMAWLDVEVTDDPHILLTSLLEDTEGLIALTGGFDGLLNRQVMGQGMKHAEENPLHLLEKLALAFPDRLYVELQRHGREEEKTTQTWLVEQAYAKGLPLVATNEAYFPTPDMYEAHDALLAIADASFIEVEDRRHVTAEHFFKSGEAMAHLFEDCPEALKNTVDIARRCSYRPLNRDPVLPGFTTKGLSEAEELARQARKGLQARLAKAEKFATEEDYQARLEHELDIISRMGFPGYFLIVADFIQWAKRQGIAVGPGRGSGAGSLVAWALTITDLDPLRFDLLFERFLNPERISMPDFDIDFCQERRGDVISYVQERYGQDRVASIITFGSLQARAVLRDVGRVMQLPLGLVDRLAKMIPNNPAHPVTLQQAIDGEPRLQRGYNEDPDVKRMIDIALRLEGLYRNAATHAAGLVIADRTLTDITPLYRDPRADLPATQFNMKWVEQAGLVKFDFLGLKTLTVMARCQAYLKERGVEVDLDTLPLDDAEVYALLGRGESIGVFQLESSGMRDVLRNMQPDSLEDLIALISLYRPGPMKNIDIYIDRKQGRSKADYLHPSLKPVLQETHGVIIYQEQVMKIAQLLSGYTLGEADILRKAMGKKQKAEMKRQKSRFLKGAKEKGVSQERASYIFELVAEFAGYGFNKSHAAAYALIAYQTAYLKTHYPVEFLAGLMSLDKANTDKLAALFQEARRMGVPVLPPDINESKADFSVKNGSILYALGAVRNVGLTAMDHVVKEREQQGPFKNLVDFAERLDARLINKRAFENLACSGAFDSLSVERGQAYAASETLTALAAQSSEARQNAQASLFSEKETEETIAFILPGGQTWTEDQILDEERAAIGFYLSGHPLDSLTQLLQDKHITFFAQAGERIQQGATALRLAGIVRKRQEKVSQKSGERFAFLRLSDPTGEFEVHEVFC